MDQMRISSTEPSSVILSQTNLFNKLNNTAPKVSKEAVQSQKELCNKPT